MHRRFEAFNGERAIAALSKMMRARYEPHPWDDIYFSSAVEHTLYDDYWRERAVLSRLPDLEIPVYLGCDWDNVPLHLPSTFWAWNALANNPHTRMTLLPRGGLCWPWESLHVEALAWFDRWLKGRDTGIDRGDRVRYWVHGAEEWRSANTWPPPGVSFSPAYLRSDGILGAAEGVSSSRSYLHMPETLERPPNANAPPLPDHLVWETLPLLEPLDVVGPISLELDAIATAGDVDWIAKLELVAPDDTKSDLTEGWLRASHRALDVAASREGAPFHSHDRFEAVPPGQVVSYSIAIVPTAQQLPQGYRLRLLLASRDTGPMAMLGFEHATLHQASRNAVLSSSRLVLPVARR